MVGSKASFLLAYREDGQDELVQVSLSRMLCRSPSESHPDYRLERVRTAGHADGVISRHLGDGMVGCRMIGQVVCILTGNMSERVRRVLLEHLLRVEAVVILFANGSRCAT